MYFLYLVLIKEMTPSFQFIFFGTLLYTLFFYKQHFYKQRQAEIGKKSSKC